MKTSMLYRCSLALAGVLAMTSTASAETVYGLSHQQGGFSFLITWDSAEPNVVLSATSVSPLGLLALDVQPSSGELFAVDGNGRLRTDLTGSGAVSPMNAGPLNGFSFGFDFNPVIDRVRLTSDTNNNLVIDPSTGALQTAATNLFYQAGDPNAGKDPNILGSAYTNSFPGAASTQLYGIDAGLDILVTQANNSGSLATVGPLGVDVASLGGFDIAGDTGIAYAAMTPAGSSKSFFYTVDLATGAAMQVGEIGGGMVITAMAVAFSEIPEPATLGLAVTTVLCAGRLHRRR
jgi:hypothetical protein